MPDLIKLADTVVNNLGNLAIQSDRCCQKRSPKSTCRLCIDVCPSESIKINQAGIEIDGCIECGLCATLCPTGALTWRAPSPLTLISKIKQCQETYSEVYVYCSNASLGKNLSQAIEVPCLGSITWQCWLWILIYNVDVKVYSSENCCSTCNVNQGYKQYRLHVDRAEQISGKSVTCVSSIIGNKRKRNRNRNSNGSVNADRRNFLGAIMNGLGRVPGKIVTRMLSEEDIPPLKAAPNSKFITEKRQVLIKAANYDNRMSERMQVQQPEIVGNCQFCKACSTLCPQGALVQKENQGTFSLEISGISCIGCELCTEVCFHEALQMTSIRINDLKEKVTLAEGRSYICQDCGSMYKAINEVTCPACQKRHQLL